MEYLHNGRDTTTIAFPHSTEPWLATQIPQLYCYIPFWYLTHIEAHLHAHDHICFFKPRSPAQVSNLSHFWKSKIEDADSWNTNEGDRNMQKCKSSNSIQQQILKGTYSGNHVFSVTTSLEPKHHNLQRALVMMMMPSGKYFQRICQAKSMPQFVMMTTFLQSSH